MNYKFWKSFIPCSLFIKYYSFHSNCYNLQAHKLNKEDAMGRCKWRKDKGCPIIRMGVSG